MKNYIFSVVFAFSILAVPAFTQAAALTTQQSTSLIAVVQSSPGTPASAFVNLITAFSNITVNQAISLITVVQASPSTPATAFVDLLTSFTADTSANQPTTPAVAPQPTQTNQPTPTLNTVPTTPSVSTVVPVIIISANPASITSGQSVTISYHVTNATSCTASGGWSGIYTAPAGFVSDWSGNRGDFYPTQATTYTFSCTGAGGSATQSVTVNPIAKSWIIDVQYMSPVINPNVQGYSFNVSVYDGADTNRTNPLKQPVTVTTNDPDLPSSFVINAPHQVGYFCIAPTYDGFPNQGCKNENPVSVGTFDFTFTIEGVSVTKQVNVQ